MLSWIDQQRNFIDTINNGPDMLNPSLFSGPVDRVILGLKAHANTISHARLVALEQTFPMTRTAMGEDSFNLISRNYCETPSGRASDLNHMGAGFVPYIAAQNADLSICDLACIEWAWLECYNAAEAEPVLLTDLSSRSEAALLAMKVYRHPATKRVHVRAALSPELAELGNGEGACAVMITRPESEVRLFLIDALTTAIFDATQNETNIGNLLSLTLEQGEDAACLQPILTLIRAGALVA